MSDILYTTEAISTGGGRDGHVDVPSAGLGFEMRAPKELGGPGEGVNPEQLFAAGYAACFHSALLGAARSAKQPIPGASVGARVSIGRSGETDIDLEVHLEVVIPELVLDVARGLAQAAHERCPYSRATRGNITVTVDVVDD